MTPREIDRRRALGLFGAAGVGAVVFGACGSDGNGSGSAGPTTTGGATDATSSSTTVASAPSGTKLGVDAFENAAGCTLTSEQTDGPYYIDVDKIRSDIREDREGTRLRVAARVLDVDGCTPVKDAKVQLSNADALTTQLYFDEKLNSAVFAGQPYATRTGRRTLNRDDGIYRSDTTLTVTEDGDGYLGVITIGIRA